MNALYPEEYNANQKKLFRFQIMGYLIEESQKPLPQQVVKADHFPRLGCDHRAAAFLAARLNYHERPLHLPVERGDHAPRLFVGHLHVRGGLSDRTCFVDPLQQLYPPRAEKTLVFAFDPERSPDDVL